MTTLAARTALLLLVALAAHASPLYAQTQLVIYRCTDASGAVTIQNDVACPAGHQQEIRTVDPPPPLPTYRAREVRMPKVVAAEQAPVETAAALAATESLPEAERTPPPALFQCATWDENTYLTEDDTPQERCAPLRTVGIDGNPQHGAGSACQTMHDQCQAVADDVLCKSWRRRVDEAQFRWKFARAGNDDPRKREYDRLAAILVNSSCE